MVSYSSYYKLVELFVILPLEFSNLDKLLFLIETLKFGVLNSLQG